MPATPERDQSEFHDDLGYLNRIDKFLMAANMASFNLQANSWFHALNVIFRELSTQMNDEEKRRYSQTITNLNNEIFKMQRRNATGITPEIYNALNSFEMELRAIYDGAGLQNRKKRDKRFGV